MNIRGAWNFALKPGVAATAIFLLALALRLSGLSHDLHLNRVYHPDTPKQIRAAERFIDGEYYTIIGGRDYEGYPYFNSHIVALIYRAYEGVRNVMVSHIGLPFESTAPHLPALYWITRMLNTVTSALTVLLICLAGTYFFNRATGLVAGLLLAVSPIDITSAHFATGDSTTAFFATGAVIAALAIGRSGRPPMYAIAALLTGAAFSTKYHGGMALIAALVAHVSRYPRPRLLVTRESLGRVALLASFLLAGIVVTSPALLVYPESAFKDIMQFLAYTSSFGMTAEMAALPLWSRFLLGMKLNMPILADVLGPGLIAASLLAIFIGAKRREIWILAALPILYVLIGLATKPLSHAVYHTLATPSLTLLGAIVIARLAASTHRPMLARSAALLLLTTALAYSINYTRHELFFFRHNDTRYLAETWSHDNLPKSLLLDTRAYTFDVSSWVRPGQEGDAAAFVLSGVTQPETPPRTFFSHAMALEDKKPIIFRNWNQYFYLPDRADYMKPNAHRAGFHPLPASRDNNIIFAEAPWQALTPKVRHLSAPNHISPTIASGAPLDRILVHVQAGPEPLSISMDVAGERRAVVLQPAEQRLIPFDRPRPLFLNRVTKKFYRTRFSASYGSGRLLIATTPSEMAWLSFNAGAYSEAHDLFDEEATPLGHLLSGLLAGRWTTSDPEFLTRVRRIQNFTDEGLLELYGISTQYVKRLPGIVWGRDDMIAEGVLPEDQNTFPPFSALHLERGRYILTLDFDEPRPPHELLIHDPWNAPIPHTETTDSDTPANRATYSLNIAPGHRLIQMRIHADPDTLASVRTLHIQADIPGTMHSLAQWLRIVADGIPDDAPLRPTYYEFFLALGDQRASDKAWQRAKNAYAAAIACAPDRRTAYERLKTIEAHIADDARTSLHKLYTPYRKAAAMFERHPVTVRLANGMRLTGYEIADHTVRRGDAVRLNLHWEVPRLGAALERHAVWLHFIPEGRKDALFYGDIGLRSVLAIPPFQDRLHPYYNETEVPADVPLGRYTIKTGIWIHTQRRNIRVRDSDIPHDKRGVFLTEIRIVE